MRDALLEKVYAVATQVQPVRNKNPVQHILLSNKFFSETEENSLTETKLKTLAEFSQSLELPSRFGLFPTDGHYLKTLELLLASTLETTHRKQFFQKAVLPALTRYNHMLDVGLGNGELTRLLAPRFNNLTLVDTSQEALNSVNRKDFVKNITISKLNQSILDVDLPVNTYDLGIISHVLYYIDNQYWLEAVRNVYNSVVPGGLVIIVLNGGLDKTSLIQRFGGKTLEISNLVRRCAETFNTTAEVFISKENFCTLGINPMLHIAGLHLYDAETTADRKQLVNYLESKHKKNNNIFKISTYQKFMLLFKNN